jgi:hypothetical protein
MKAEEGDAAPFNDDPALRKLLGNYPTPEAVAQLAACKSKLAQEAFVRLWLTEGTPYLFQKCPAIYEDLRSWLAKSFGVCPKDITILGSARLGFSLSPPPKFGRPFGEKSDLDLALVSPTIFEEFRRQFSQWEKDYENGVEMPCNPTERSYWDENKDFGRRNFPRGFFDAKKLPNRDPYPIAKQVNNAMWALIEKLKVTPGAPVIRKEASVRVFRDWKSLVARVSYNLGRVLSKMTAPHAMEPSR